MTVTMSSNSEVTIRCFQPEDSVRCRTIFTEGIMEICIPLVKTFYRDFYKGAAVFLVLVTAIAVKWSMWTLLVLYFLAFAVITVAVYISVCQHMMHNFINRSLKSDLSDIEKYYDGNDSCMFVAERDARVIGMVGVDTKRHHKHGVAELRRMSVCSSARKKGIGTNLVNKVMDYCKEKKYEKIIVSTLNPRNAAIALYKKHGFKFVKSERYPHYQYSLFNINRLHFEKILN